MTRSEMAMAPVGAVRLAHDNLGEGPAPAGVRHYWKRHSARASRHAIERLRLAEERAVETDGDLRDPKGERE